jgi:hypothetical protein
MIKSQYRLKAILESFANDPAYDEAMQLGRQYRESLRPQAEITLAT